MSLHSKLLSRPSRLVVAAATLLSPLAVATSAAAASPTSFHVNFGAQTTAAYPGYSLDYGLAYTDTTGQGWEAAADGSALSLVGNGRERNLAASPDKRYDTQMQMQETSTSSGVKTPGQWEHAIANGTYAVTVAVGDASATNSVDRITAEPGGPNSVVIINNFVPSAGAYFSTVTSNVTVSDGKLTLNPNGGTNTKIDFVDVVPASGADITAPTASVSLSGTVVSGTTYSGTVTAMINASDEVGGSGLKSTSYTIDNGPPVAYDTPFPITASGTHTIVVTATDNAGNIGTATSTFSIAVPAVDTTPPTVSIALGGTVVSGSVYQGTVLATVTAADEAGGSGLASTTYSLDGAAPVAYGAPLSISAVGTHTLSVTAKDVAGNTGTAAQSFTIAPVSSGGPTSFHVNFGAQTTAAYPGYTLDYGVAFSTATGQGWEAMADGTPLSLVGNGRERNLAASPDKRYDTQMQMQETATSSGVKTPGQWEHTIANGTYAVTVAVGDASATNSVDSITAEPGSANAVTIINGFVPSTTAYFSTVTANVTVADGRLTLSPVGGSNTKIDFVDVVPATVVDKTAPTATVGLAGTAVSAGVYTGTVTATIAPADEAGGSGVKSTSYVLDSNPSLPYTGSFPVSGNGTHTIVVTITDNAGNVGTVTSSFVIQAAAVDNTPPSATVSLTGNLVSAGVYQGPVKVTINASDNAGGSGVATTSYTINGGDSHPYTGTFTVADVQSYAIVVTVTDNAGNSGGATSDFAIQSAPDTTAPTASVSLSGTTYTAGVYYGTVTATISAADEAGGSGLATTSYTLDGGASTPYTGAFTVSGVKTHTIVVTVTDNAGNSGGTTSTFPIVASDTTAPSATVNLAGTAVSAGVYTGTVTATITPADEPGGSGVKSTTYKVDGGSPSPYTAPFSVKGYGSHTVVATITDNAGNIGTATSTFSIADQTNPTASVTLAGTVVSAGVYTGTVTATIASADETGGSGLASTTYTLDGGGPNPYTGPVPVTGNGPHTIVVTATDNAGNVGNATSSFTIQAAPTDTTPPTTSISLAGTVFSPGNYQGTVTATITAADEKGGSGLKSTTYTLDAGTVTPYTAPIVVAAPGSHTINVSATDNAGNVGTATATFVIQPTGAAQLSVVSPDDAVLANPSTPRLVFSNVRGNALTAPRAFTFTNNGSGPLLVSNLAIGGTNANNWRLATGQATSVTIAPGASAQISIQFAPTDPTGCASTASPYAIGDVDRNATLTYTTNDSAVPTGTDILAGINSCYAGGNSEPVLDQILPELGYTDVVDTQYIDRRYIGPLRYLQGTDEIQSPYFTAANAAQPVSVVPIAHYGSASATPYQATGYYAQGSAMTSPKSACSSACKTLWQFPADSIVNGVTTYNQDQLMLPSVLGTTTFTPTGNFGFFSGDYSDVNFSDDSLNIAHDKSNNPLAVPHYLHDLRIFPAYGPGHVVIPNTYIIGIDLSRVPAYKNNDFQDIILLVRNVKPAVNQATVLTATNDIANLTAPGGVVTSTCGVTGFDGVMVNTGGTQCNAANIGFTTSGLQLISTAGQFPNGNQQNGLYKAFDATRGAFTVDAQVVGPITQLASNYQQIAAFFGPDQSNFLKLEIEHNGSAGDPHLTMFYDVKGVTSTVASVSVPALTTASTVDLIIKGNTSVPDPLPFGDTYGVHGFPLDELTLWYSINGAAPVQLGTTTEFPADVTTWFSRAAKAGIVVSNSGSATPITATFSKFSVTSP